MDDSNKTTTSEEKSPSEEPSETPTAPEETPSEKQAEEPSPESGEKGESPDDSSEQTDTSETDNSEPAPPVGILKSPSETAENETPENPKGIKRAPHEAFEIPDDLKKPPPREEATKDEEFLQTLKSSDSGFVPVPPPETSKSEEEISEPPPVVTETEEKSPTEEAHQEDADSPHTALTIPEDEPDVPVEQEKEADSPQVVPVPEEKDEEASDTSETSEIPEKETQPSSPEPEEKKTKRPSFFQRKRSSVVRFFTGKSIEQEDQPEEPIKKPKRRPSFIRRKLIALEKELTIDNIHEKVARVFVPDSFQMDAEKEEEKKEGEPKPQRVYLSSGMACIFLVSAITGSGIASLPYYLKQSSWYGIFLSILFGLNAMYAGMCYSWCWCLMEERWPEYLEYSRVPYQDIAHRAVGKWMKYIVAICVDITVFLTCAGYITLIADALEDVAQEYFDFCISLLGIAIVLVPATMFGSYRHIKYIGICDVLLSVLFTLFIVISIFLDKPGLKERSLYTDPSIGSVFNSFSGLIFAYGTPGVVPSIMSGMEDKSMFAHTCATAYMISMALYILLSITGYAAFGHLTKRAVENHSLFSDQYFGLAVFIIVLFVLQLATTYVITLMPTLHAFEDRLNSPDHFSIFRIIIRLIIEVCILAFVLAVPYMPKYMDVVASTVTNLLTYVFPPIFYVCLVYRQSQASKRRISKKEWFLVVETLAVAAIVGVVSTYVSINVYQKAFPNRVTCYLNMTSGKLSDDWFDEDAYDII